MSAGGGAMVRGNTLSSNKCAPTEESLFTKTRDTLNYPRVYHDALQNTKKALTMVDKSGMVGDTIETVDWARPLNSEDSYQKITHSTQTAAPTYLTGGTVLEFNIIVPQGQFFRPADWELVLPVRFRTEDNVPIDLGRYIPVNNLFGHYLETLTISRKDNMKPIVRPRPSGSIATYMRSIMEDMTPDQLAVIENGVLFDRSQVTGDNVHHRLHDGDQLATYNHLLQRRNRFAPVVAGAENWVAGRAIPEGNLIWQDVKYVISVRLLSPFFLINK